MRHVWTLRLTVPLLVWSLVRDGWRGTLYHAVTVTPRIGELIRGLRRLGLPHPAVVIEEPAMSGSDSDGRCLVYRLESLCMAFARATVAPVVRDLGWLPTEYRHLGEEWTRLLMSDVVHRMRETAALLVYARDQARRTGEPAVCYVAAPVLSRRLARFFMRDVGGEGDIVARGWPTARAMLTAAYPIPHRPGYWLRLARATLAGSVVRPAMGITPTAQAQGVILEQGFHWAFKLFPAAGHLYWVENSGIPRERIAVYLNRSDTPCDDTTRQVAAALGLGWADAEFLPDQLDRPLIDSLRILWRMRRSFPRRPSAVGLWRWSLASRTAIRLEGWRALLRRTGARALKQHQIFQPDTIALVMACRMEDVAFVFNFWSIHQYLVAQHQMGMADLLLPWGGFHHGFFSTQDFLFRRMVQVGMVAGDGVTGSEAEEAAALRARLAPQVRFVVTVFDTSYQFSSHNGVDQVLDFYATVLATVRRHPHWGCVVKSKGAALATLPADPRVQPELAALEAEGRCLVLSGWERISTAAVASDIVTCCSVNSAGFDAALIGRRTLHLDLSALVAHPIALAGGDGRIIFRTTEAFAAAMDRAEHDPIIGDHGPWIDLIDPFHDGSGRFRVGALLKDYLDARDAGLGRDAALDRAVDLYAARHGSPLVSRPEDKADGQGDRLWRQSRDMVLPDWPPSRYEERIPIPLG